MNILILAASRLPWCIPQTIEQLSLVLILPLFVLYQYAHAVVKIYALMTITEVSQLMNTFRSFAINFF